MSNTENTQIIGSNPTPSAKLALFNRINGYVGFFRIWLVDIQNEFQNIFLEIYE